MLDLIEKGLDQSRFFYGGHESKRFCVERRCSHTLTFGTAEGQDIASSAEVIRAVGKQQHQEATLGILGGISKTTVGDGNQELIVQIGLESQECRTP
jgi:hypothetical protein